MPYEDCSVNASEPFGETEMRQEVIWLAALLALVAMRTPVLSQTRPSPAATAKPPVATPPASNAQLALIEQLNENTVTIVSGNINGTYLSLAYDLAAVLDDGTRMRVLPVIGKGGYQNMVDLLHLRGIDLAITQSDVLSYLKQTEALGPGIDQRVVYIAKLYNEEMHILAGPGVERLEDLAGKRVNLSDKGSGTQFTAKQIFKKLGITIEEVNVGQADGYEKVRNGEIAATILFGGKPTAAFSRFTLEPGMKIVDVPYPEALEADYFPAKLTAEDYPNLIEKGKSVNTVAVGAVLAAYNWPKTSDRYRRIANFTTAFFAQLSGLQRPPRHIKWRETNLSATLRTWKRLPAADDWLAKPRKSEPHEPDLSIVRTQAAKVAPNDLERQEKLVRDYLEWHKTQQEK